MNTIVDEDLPMQVDCTQWHPKADVIAVGAYQLNKHNSSERRGRLYILQLTPQVPGGFSVILEQETNGGVLDLKFHSTEDFDFIAVGTSTGVSIYLLSIEPEPVLTLLHSLDSHMCLYLEWINENTIIFSDSEGNVNLIENDEEDGNKFKITKTKKVHETLTWYVHYSVDQELVYCGSDNGKLNVFTLTEMSRSECHLLCSYEVGVTSISTKQEIVAVGGYDDVLKIYELVQTTPRPVLQIKTQIHLEAAVWRSLWLPNLQGDEETWILATACMRKGVKFLVYDRRTGKIEIRFQYMKYEGYLAYGIDVKIDWKRLKYRVASGYFDNHVVHVFEL